MAEMSSRYRYVKGLADSAQERAKKAHLNYQALDDAGEAVLAASALNDFFYWIGHSNAYRGIALQVDFMETVEADEDAESRCP